MTFSSVPIRAEDYQISDDPAYDNVPALTQAFDDARALSREVTLPPADLALYGSLDPGGLKIRGTQAGTGTRLRMKVPGFSPLRYGPRSPDGQIARGSIEDMTILADVHTGRNAIHAEGDSASQPDHLRLVRLRITRGDVGSWNHCIAINGMARSSGAVGNRGFYAEELLLFESTTYHMALFGAHDAVLIGVKCYTPQGNTWGFFIGGSSGVPSKDCRGYGCEGPIKLQNQTNTKFL